MADPAARARELLIGCVIERVDPRLRAAMAGIESERFLEQRLRVRHVAAARVDVGEEDERVGGVRRVVRARTSSSRMAASNSPRLAAPMPRRMCGRTRCVVAGSAVSFASAAGARGSPNDARTSAAFWRTRIDGSSTSDATASADRRAFA